MKQYSKKTKEGIEVTLEGKTIKKVYSKLRKGHKVL